MGLIFQEMLPGPYIFNCKCCKAHLTSYDAIISKDFHGRFGKAYLFKSVVNISLGPSEDRQLMSGLHTVNDIYCSCCQQILGWRYEKAYEESEKYKEGKYILEKSRILKDGCLPLKNDYAVVGGVAGATVIQKTLALFGSLQFGGPATVYL